ncbi:MAG: hypothetical protein K9G48_08605 [Reyranella sp.]|nr:hypothetical protein [Reyranella sp.]
MTDQTQTIRIVIDARPAKDGGEDAKRALRGIEDQTGRMGASLDKMGDKLGAAVGRLKAFAVAAGIAWATAFAGQALNAAANLGELSQQVGITITGLQGLQYVAVQNNLRLEQLDNGIGKFSQKIGEAAEGSKEMVDALRLLGVMNLDVTGKLRPTEDVMTDVARAMMALEDPAKRSSAAVDFFGKAGIRMLPMLKEVAKGTDYLTASAERAGAMISEQTSTKLDKYGDAAAMAALKLRASFAEGVVGVIEWLEKLEVEWNDSANSINAWLKKQGAGITEFVDDLAVAGARGATMFLEAFRALPEQMGKLFTDGMNAAIEAVEWGLNAINRGLEDKAPWLGIKGNAIKLPRIDGGGASFDDYSGRIAEAGDAAAAKMRGLQDAARARAAEKAWLDRQASFEEDEAAARIGGGVTARTTGAGYSKVLGAGGAEAKRIEKVLGDAQMQADYGAKIAEAAREGAAAVDELERRYKSAKAAQDAYGDSAKANAPLVQALADKLYELGKAADKTKSLAEFRLGTDALRSENELLEAEVRLANELPEIRARELAIIKVTQEVKKKGIEDSREDIDARIAAVQQQDLLKQKIEETKKASDLWLEPVKGAMQSLQSTAADTWQGILESGEISFQSLGDVFKKTVVRMAAEFLALATVRPVMSVLVQGATSLGFMSGGQASSMGFGGGGAGGFSMPSFGGGNSFFGGLGDWLNTPFTGPYAGMSPSSMQGVPMLSGSAGAGITPLGALGAAAGAAGGIYQLATSKSTAGTIGGIGSLIGAGVSLIPGVGQIAGPLIMAASALLPGLFGGEEYKWDPLAGANVQFNPTANGYTSNATQQLGGKSIAGQFAGVGSTLDAFFEAAGGITDAGKAFGAAVWNNQREGTTSTYEISPSQGSHQLTYDESGDPAAAIDRMIAKVFYNSIQNNAAMNASPTLRTAFGNREPTSTAEISGLFDLITVYDELGQTTSQTETALKAIDERFESMADSARSWGLALEPIEAEQKKQTERAAQDFIDSMLDPMAVQLRELDDQRKDAIAGAEYIRDNIEGVYVDMARISDYWLRKEAQLKEQLYGGAVAQLEDAIKRLSPGGSLDNLDPSGTLAGMQATYRATYGQAAAGDASAISRLGSEGVELADYAKSYFAGSPEYNALRDEILANFQTIQAAIQAPSGANAPLDVNNPAISSLVQQVQTLTQLVQTQSAENTRLTALLSRYLTNGQRAA